MILISALVNEALYEVIQRHQTWIEDTFVSESTEESLNAVVTATRHNNPDAFILLVIPSEFEEYAKTLPCNATCIFNGGVDEVKNVESSILYQGSPAVHRLVDNYKKQLAEASSSSQNSEELAWRVAEIESLQEKLTDSKLEIEARDKHITELEDEKVRLIAEIENMQADAVHNNTELGAQRVQEENQHREEVQALNDRIQSLTEERAREVAQMTEAIRTRDATIDELNTTLANANAQVEILRKGNEANANAVQEDESKQQLQQQFLEAQRELITLRSQVESLNHELAGSNVTIEALTNQQELLKTEVRAANERADASKKTLEEVQRNIGDSANEMIRLRAENAQLHQEKLEACNSVKTVASEELSLGLAKYTGRALIIGVFGYGSSYYTANVAASVANSLGTLTDVALIDLDPCYSSINGFYNVSRFTAKDTTTGKSAPYVSALNDKAYFTAGFTKAKQNKSGSVYYGGGCLGGMKKLNADRFVEELNGLAATLSYIVLNLGCLSPDIYPVLSEISVAGKLVCAVDGAKMPVKIVAGQLTSCSIPPQDASWVLVSDTPVVDGSVESVLSGANTVMVTESRANSRDMTLETGQFGRTFANFVSTLSQ